MSAGQKARRRRFWPRRRIWQDPKPHPEPPLTIAGAKMGPVGAFIGNKAGAALGALKSAGIKQTGDLVKEAMLNPALARALLAKLTPETEQATANRALDAITRLSAVRGAHTVVAVHSLANRRPADPDVPMNPLAGLGGGAGQPPPNLLAGVGR